MATELPTALSWTKMVTPQLHAGRIFTVIVIHVCSPAQVKIPSFSQETTLPKCHSITSSPPPRPGSPQFELGPGSRLLLAMKIHNSAWKSGAVSLLSPKSFLINVKPSSTSFKFSFFFLSGSRRETSQTLRTGGSQPQAWALKGWRSWQGAEEQVERSEGRKHQ